VPLATEIFGLQSCSVDAPADVIKPVIRGGRVDQRLPVHVRYVKAKAQTKRGKVEKKLKGSSCGERR